MKCPPLISCLMPTADRRAFVPGAVRAFLDQDYPNLELVVLDDGADPVADLMPADDRVRYARLPAKLTIGAKRNECVRRARGDLLLHWDDDDWHAPARVRRQADALRAARADVCGMRRVLFHDPLAPATWLYNYAAGGAFWAVGGSLLYTREFWQRAPFPDVTVGEDTRFLWAHLAPNGVAIDDLDLYVARIHPANTSPKDLAGAYWSRWTGAAPALVGSAPTRASPAVEPGCVEPAGRPSPWHTVFAGPAGVVYAIDPTGTGQLVRHVDDESGELPAGRVIGHGGWRTDFHAVFHGGNGVLYAIDHVGTGRLLRYVDDGHGDLSAGRVIGYGGWKTDLHAVFAGGPGVIYGIDHVGSGRLVRYADDGRGDLPAGRVIGYGGWKTDLHAVFAGGPGVIYGIDHVGGGRLVRYVDDGRGDLPAGRVIGHGGWKSDLRAVVADADGVLYAVDRSGAGRLIRYIDDGHGDLPAGRVIESAGWAAVLAGGPGVVYGIDNSETGNLVRSVDDGERAARTVIARGGWKAARCGPPRLRRPTRVGFLGPNIWLGGVEQWLAALVRYSSPEELSWQVGLVADRPSDPRMAGRIADRAGLWCGRAGVRQVVATSEALVVWGVTDASWFSDFRGPIVAIAHGCGAWTEGWLARVRPVVTHLAAVSPVAARSFGGAAVRVIENGIDPARCRALRSRDEVRREWGLALDEIAVGYVGRLSAEKNCPAAAVACRELGRPYRPVYIGPVTIRQVIDEVRAVAPNAIFVPPVEHVGDALHALDVVVLASPSEGAGLVFLEAMFAGVPVVATPVGVMPELIARFGELAVMVPVHPSAHALAAAVLRATSSGWSPVIPLARAAVSEHYLASHMAQNWTRYIHEVLN